ncbi:type II secretion system F family protein [Acidobacteria bacterium AB60]|nr:type II secretion system F family protein [Acidobacteria bacterium AB60]
MAVVAILVFIAVFALITPVVLIASGGAKKSEKQQAAAALDTAIGGVARELGNAVVNFRKSETASAIPWLNKRLESLDIIPRLRKMLAQAEVKWTPTALILMTVTCFAIPGYLVDLRTGSVLLGLLVGGAVSLVPSAYVWFLRSKRFSKFEQGLPEALDLMVSALRVGHSFNSAMGLVTRECAEPVGPEFRIAFDEQNFGLELRTALENLIDRVPIQDLRMVVTAILIQRESGGNLAEVLEKTANVIRQRFRLKKQVMVHTAQGRLTGWILTILPIALGIGLYIVNPETMSLLWTRAIGIKLMWGAGAMMVIGTLIIQKIVRMEV